MQTVDMTKGSPYKQIVVFAIPILISNIFQQIYNSADSIIVGNFVGREALAAVSSSSSLIFLFTSFFTGTALGAGVLISRFFGQKNYKDMREAIHTTIAFGIVASIIVTILGVFFSPLLLKLMGTDEKVLPESITYFRYYFCGSFGVIMYNCFSSILQAVGNSRRPLYYLILASVLNVLLDLLFVGLFNMGVGGAAIATAISQFMSALLCYLFLIRKGTIYEVKIKEIRFKKDKLLGILKYGIPSGVQNSVIGLANVIVQSSINSFGDIAMAGCGSYQKLEGFAFLPITCFTMAISTYISQNLGAKNYDNAKKGARFGIITSVLLSELLGLLMYLLAPYLVALFNNDPEVVSYGVAWARTVSLFYFLLAFSHCIAAVFRGAGKAFIPMAIMLIVWCVIRVIYISIAIHLNHVINLVFWAYPLTWGISSVIYFFYYKFSNWVYGFKSKEEVHALEKLVASEKAKQEKGYN